MGIRRLAILLAFGGTAAVASCGGLENGNGNGNGNGESATAATAPAERGGQEEFGPYELVEDWPKPLPDGSDGVTHAGWTWGSAGAIWAETPDRIWIAMRGELPLPPGAAQPPARFSPRRNDTRTHSRQRREHRCERPGRARARRMLDRRGHHGTHARGARAATPPAHVAARPAADDAARRRGHRCDAIAAGPGGASGPGRRGLSR